MVFALLEELHKIDVIPSPAWAELKHAQLWNKRRRSEHECTETQAIFKACSHLNDFFSNGKLKHASIHRTKKAQSSLAGWIAHKYRRWELSGMSRSLVFSPPPKTLSTKSRNLSCLRRSIIWATFEPSYLHWTPPHSCTSAAVLENVAPLGKTPSCFDRSFLS